MIVVSSANFNKFINNSEDYETSDDEIEAYTDTEDMEHYLVFTFKFKNTTKKIIATGEMGGFYYKGIFYIHVFAVDPQNQGWGSRLIKYISDKFIEQDINLEVIDIADESRDFWNKMEDRGLVLTGNYPDMRDYYGYDANRTSRVTEDEYE
jgi:GNAT superfamily N-acetyltransferase